MMNASSVTDLPKRFYKTADIEAGEGGWRVVLDGRPVRTPSGAELMLPVEALARAVAEEWGAQVELIDIPRMHLTRLVNVAIDRTPETRSELAEEAVRYAQTDLVCHLAEGPQELRERQERSWRPLRDWAGETLGVLLLPVEGVMAVRQPPASIDAVRAYALEQDDLRLTALSFATGLLGSVVLALAVMERKVSAPNALVASRVDELFQAEQWGEDDEAVAQVREQILAANALDVFLSTTR